MVLSKRAKLIMFVIAVLMLCAAVIWNIYLNEQGDLSKLTNIINAYGYSFDYGDFYAAGSTPDTSIAQLLKDTDLSEAVAASKAAGFPSDIYRVGEVSLLLASLSDTQILTLYAVDGVIELCFLQDIRDNSVYPISGRG